MTTVKGEVLVAGKGGSGPGLVLTAPISFWGGIDPTTGRIVDVRHPEHGVNIAGTVLFLPGTIGSSSASAVLLELVHNGHAPAALVLHEPDAILLLGLIVAREMGWETPVALRLDRSRFRPFAGHRVFGRSRRKRTDRQLDFQRQHAVRRPVAVAVGADVDDHLLAHVDAAFDRRRSHVRQDDDLALAGELDELRIDRRLVLEDVEAGARQPAIL